MNRINYDVYDILSEKIQTNKLKNDLNLLNEMCEETIELANSISWTSISKNKYCVKISNLKSFISNLDNDIFSIEESLNLIEKIQKIDEQIVELNNKLINPVDIEKAMVQEQLNSLMEEKKTYENMIFQRWSR